MQQIGEPFLVLLFPLVLLSILICPYCLLSLLILCAFFLHLYFFIHLCNILPSLQYFYSAPVLFLIVRMLWLLAHCALSISHVFFHFYSIPITSSLPSCFILFSSKAGRPYTRSNDFKIPHLTKWKTLQLAKCWAHTYW